MWGTLLLDLSDGSCVVYSLLDLSDGSLCDVLTDSDLSDGYRDLALTLRFE